MFIVPLVLMKSLMKFLDIMIIITEGASPFEYANFSTSLFSPLSSHPSGNPVLRDIGMLLKSRLASHLGPTANVTLIDTIPMIRTALASSQDHIHCRVLAQAAVDAAFAGG